VSPPADEGSAGLDATEVTPAGRDEPAAVPAATGAVTADALVAEIPGLWRFALALMRDEADAEDLVQETLARALERGSSFRGESGLATWLHRIAHNLAVDGFRRRGREVDVDEVEDRWRDDDYTVDAEAVADRAHDRAELEDALVHLPFALRAAVLLHDVEGWTVKEIAEMSEIGVPAAKQRLRRGRMALVSELARNAERRAALDGVPLRCWDARRLVSDYLDGELAEGEAHGVEAHLAGCPTCPPLYAGLVEARTSLSDLRDPNSVIDPRTAARLRAHLGVHDT
jgi:RNA polymerase sigma-70 factor (ECF subfamily)